MRFHIQTGGSTLTAQQPKNNISRITVQALAAVLGGTQSLHTNGYDEALNLPTEEAASIALRTQQIIAFESGVANTADPLAGSYFVEKLTDDVENAAWELINKIEAMGGSVSAIEQGFMQNEIAASAYAYQQKIESGEKIIVGVNAFKEEQEVTPPSFAIDDNIRQVQIQKLNELRAKRNNEMVATCLKNIKDHATNNKNLMPVVIDAVENYCTLGEISDVLRLVFGEYK
jgi:methylmalonyl-CoA mutase N-terminal domain/subunit